MADDKNSRDKKGLRDEKRQMERDMSEARRRMGEEPPIEEGDLEELEDELVGLNFPATGAEVVEEVGDRVVESVAQTYTVKELVPDTEVETYESPSAVRERVQRPSVAASMKRIAEAVDTVSLTEFDTSQRNTYEKTLRELREIDADDHDEGVEVVTDWIVEQIREKEKLPSSRAVRRHASKFCRENGYPISKDSWLGV